MRWRRSFPGIALANDFLPFTFENKIKNSRVSRHFLFLPLLRHPQKQFSTNCATKTFRKKQNNIEKACGFEEMQYECKRERLSVCVRARVCVSVCVCLMKGVS